MPSLFTKPSLSTIHEYLSDPLISPRDDEEAGAVVTDTQSSPDEGAETEEDEEANADADADADAAAKQLAMNLLHLTLAVASIFMITLAATATEPPKCKPQIISISCLPFCWAALYYCNDTIKTATIPCTKKQPLAAIISPLLVGIINYIISRNTNQNESHVSNTTNGIYILSVISFIAYCAECNKQNEPYNGSGVGSMYRCRNSDASISSSDASNHSSHNNVAN